MSGHNKWSKIKNKKAVTDSQKSKIFGKLVRLIQVEAKKCGGDTNSPGLRIAIEKARKENMPNDNIERAVKKAGEQSTEMQEVLFEAYGPGGAGIIITGLTDNNNRTNMEIKHILSKHDCALGGKNSVLWNFSKNISGEWIPSNQVEMSKEDGEKLSLLIEELEEQNDVQEVTTNAI